MTQIKVASLEEEPKEKKKEHFIGRLWRKTIFPDLIARKKEVNQIKKEVQFEAKKEALKELKPALMKQYKEKELRKLTGEKDESKKSVGSKFAEAMKLPENFGSDEQLAKMLGKGSGTNDMTEKILGKKSESKKEFKDKPDEKDNKWVAEMLK